MFTDGEVGQPYAPAALYPQEDSWYSFLLEAEATHCYSTAGINSDIFLYCAFHGDVSIQTLQLRMVEWRVIDCKGFRREYLLRNRSTIPAYTWRNWGILLGTSFSVADIPFEVRNEHLSHESMESYRCAKSLSLLELCM
jgi:hypothetical protein